jgi:hypothetical protein
VIDELRDFLTKTRAGIARKTHRVTLMLALQAVTMIALFVIALFWTDARSAPWAPVLLGLASLGTTSLILVTFPRVRAGRALLRKADECLAAVEDLPPLLNAFTIAEWVQHTTMHDSFEAAPPNRTTDQP